MRALVHTNALRALTPHAYARVPRPRTPLAQHAVPPLEPQAQRRLAS